MKGILLSAITMTMTVSTAMALQFPEYDTDKACAEAAAIAIEEGMDSADAIGLSVLCRSVVGISRDIAEPLWARASEAQRLSCSQRAEQESRDRGISQGWYPILVDCLGERELNDVPVGKSGRAPGNQGR